MFLRAGAPILSYTHADNRMESEYFRSGQFLERHSGRIITRDISEKRISKNVNESKSSDRWNGLGLEMLFPHLSSMINKVFGYSWVIKADNIWPPSCVWDRSGWISLTDARFLPRGNESITVLARVNYPLAIFRIPILGPSYLRALCILFNIGYSSECSWPDTESSIESFNSSNSFINIYYYDGAFLYVCL